MAARPRSPLGTRLRRLRRDDGIAATEFALILPILLMLTLGIIDGSILFFKWITIGQTSREAVRSVIDQPGDDFADYSGVKAATLVFAAIPDADVQRIVIYRATPDSDGDGNPLNNPPPAACLSGTTGVAGVCNVYTSSDLRADRTSYVTNRRFQYWPGSTRDVWADATDTDYVGVYVAATVTPPTGVLGGTRTMSQFTVARIEPQATNPPLS
ncbi:MAG: pilus assembly protein [Acidimicrobiales bacterium]|nr:pilus assembly protein [Acidimicrobiales bacterium]